MFKKSLASLIMLASVGFGLSPTATHADESPTITLDAQVIQSAPTTNYGTGDNLSARNINVYRRYSYIRVTAPALPAGDSLVKANLRLYVTATAPGATLAADPVTSVWSEASVTWNTRPTATVSPISVPATAGWISIPVNVTPGALATFRIRTNSETMIVFSSSENPNLNGPELVIDTNTATAFPPTGPITTKLLGMSTARTAGDTEWDTRVNEVGGPCGLETRRVYAKLTAAGNDKADLIADIIADGMMPIISYKFADDAPSDAPQRLANGEYDAWLEATETYLNGLNTNVTVTYWHEPLNEPTLTTALYQAGAQKFLDIIDSPRIAQGPIFQGGRLDNPADAADFYAHASPALLAQWDFFGVDSYQSGSAAAPGAGMPGRAIPLLEDWLDTQGKPNMPIILGEYNAFTAAALTAAENYIFGTPEVWTAILWNATGSGGLGTVLTGDRITAFQATKANLNAWHDPAKCG